jgi:hypothetical protein
VSRSNTSRIWRSSDDEQPFTWSTRAV